MKPIPPIIKRFSHLIDDVIEDMESYIEADNNLSYADELHKRIVEAGGEFIQEEVQSAQLAILNKVLNLQTHTFQPIGGISNIKYIQLGDVDALKQSLVGKENKND